MFRIIMMALSLATVIILNITANFFSLNGHTTEEIANRLPVLFIPANFVLLLWIPVIILLFNWIFNFGKSVKIMKAGHQNRVTALFFTVCLSQVAWILLWHHSLFDWTVVMEVVLLGALLALYFSYPARENRLLGRVPFSLLVGWAFISTISNISYTLMIHDWSGIGLSDPLWTVIYLTISTAFALHFMYHHRDYVMNLVFVWIFAGIAFRNGTEELFISAASLFLSAVIIVCIFLFSKRMEDKKR